MIIIEMGACPTKTPKQTTRNSPILKSKIFHMLTKKWRGGGGNCFKIKFSVYIFIPVYGKWSFAKKMGRWVLQLTLKNYAL